jgi:hypothetical protein
MRDVVTAGFAADLVEQKAAEALARQFANTF